ncbi:hypothetical protein RHGRI_005396 [Rhododendron griersonianum]|uniref:Uncharacterized protein n=1 Tax=Rhododendron griersonianum TaxID=479676 RepID=A0AAV6LEB1_9ERIC|nr:hypothetical protein RHGRI_005396 [Rhododendron griersonianum]
MADDKITRSKLSEKDHKDTEDEDVHANISGPNAEDTSKEKSKATTQAQKTEEEEATKKELQIGVGDQTKGLESETNKSVHGEEIAGSSGVETGYASEIQSSETEMPKKTDDEKFESVKAEVESFSAGECVSSDLTKSDDSKLESYTSDDAGAVTPDLIGGVSSAENEGELKQSESGSSVYLDAHTTFKELEKKSGLDLEIDTNMEGLEEDMYKVVHRARKGKAKLEEEVKDLEIDTNMEGLKEEMYDVVHRARKGKAKLEEEGKELDDDPEVESDIEGPVKAMRELYRQVTTGTEGKLGRLMKNREEYTSEDEDEESNRKCEMLLKTPLRLMIELDTEIRGLVEELEELITSKDDKAGRKLRALSAELEALKESNYQKEVEVIGMVKGLIIDDGAEEESEIDAVVYSGVGPMVEEAKERIARVRTEIEEVEMDRNKCFGCCGGVNVEFLLNWK